MLIKLKKEAANTRLRASYPSKQRAETTSNVMAQTSSFIDPKRGLLKIDPMRI